MQVAPKTKLPVVLKIRPPVGMIACSSMAQKQTLAMISVSLLRERENLRSSTQVRDTLYLATTKAGLNGSAKVPRWSSLMKRKAALASTRFL